MNIGTPIGTADRPRHSGTAAEAADYLVGEDERALARAERPTIGAGAIRAALVRNRWAILIVVALALAAGLGIALAMAPTYVARATVQVDERAARVTGTEDAESAVSTGNLERFLQTQVDVLDSRMLAGRVLDVLHGTANPGLLAALGVAPAADGPAALRERAIDRLQKAVDVGLPRDSQIIAITVTTGDPQASATIANTFATQFVQSNLQRKFDQSAYARTFVSRQLGQAKARLEQSELALNAYARSARLIDGGGGARDGSGAAPPSLIGANLIQLNQTYATARTNRLQLEERWNAIRSVAPLTLPEVLNNPAVQQLSARRSELQAQYQNERQHHTADYPTVQQAAAQIAELDRQIVGIAGNIRRSVGDAYRVALRQEQAADADLGRVKSQAFSEQDRSVRYTILKREADTNRQLYDALLQRYKQLSSEAGATSNNVAFVDQAEPPVTPRKPRLALVLAGALVAGLAAAAVLVGLREYCDDTIRTPAAAERLGVPLLAVIPRVGRRARAAGEASGPRSKLAEAYHSLYSAVDLAMADRRVRSVFVTSSREGEGKSTTALALARTAAGGRSRILLVDADLRKPSLHRRLHRDGTLGLADVLAGRIGWTEAAQATGITGLDFLASGPLPANPAALLAEVRLPELIAAWRERYDLVVIDGPPVLGLADAPRLAALVDYSLFVVEADRAGAAGIRAALGRLQTAHARRIACVLTKADPRTAAATDELYAYGDPVAA